MRESRQKIFAISLLVFFANAGICHAINTNDTPRPPAFSLNCEAVKKSPGPALKIIEKELIKNPNLITDGEMEARLCLGDGFHSIGALKSSEKNYLRCIALMGQDHSANKETPVKCMKGLAAVDNYLSQGINKLDSLYSLRNSPAVINGGGARFDFYYELINSYSVHLDSAKVGQLASEMRAGIIPPGDLYHSAVLDFFQGKDLVYQKNYGSAKSKLTAGRRDAAQIKNANQKWISSAIPIAEAEYYIGTKDFPKARISFQEGYNSIDPKVTGFDQFYIELHGLIVGFYNSDKEMVSKHYHNAQRIIQGTEMEGEFSNVINAWFALSERKAIEKQIEDIIAVVGPKHIFVTELREAREWKGYRPH